MYKNCKGCNKKNKYESEEDTLTPVNYGGSKYYQYNNSKKSKPSSITVNGYDDDEEGTAEYPIYQTKKFGKQSKQYKQCDDCGYDSYPLESSAKCGGESSCTDCGCDNNCEFNTLIATLVGPTGPTGPSSISISIASFIEITNAGGGAMLYGNIISNAQNFLPLGTVIGKDGVIATLNIRVDQFTVPQGLSYELYAAVLSYHQGSNTQYQQMLTTPFLIDSNTVFPLQTSLVVNQNVVNGDKIVVSLQVTCSDLASQTLVSIPVSGSVLIN